MKTDIYTEVSHHLLFTAFDSTKNQKSDKFRVHHHVELELGYIISGDGEYLYIQDIDPEDQIERIRMKDILEKLRE